MTDEQDVISQIASHYEAIIKLIGEDPQREGLRKTPIRAAKALYYACQGYHQKPEALLGQAIFEDAGSKIVVVRDIEFYSLCEHHILPFFGNITIGYIPDGKMAGLSKFARLVDSLARRFQVQERLTAEICKVVYDVLGTKGVIVKCTAQHLCMKMRGVEKQDSSTTTICHLGLFSDDERLRRDFFQSINDR